MLSLLLVPLRLCLPFHDENFDDDDNDVGHAYAYELSQQRLSGTLSYLMWGSPGRVFTFFLPSELWRGAPSEARA